jgi:hypothetical protein
LSGTDSIEWRGNACSVPLSTAPGSVRATAFLRNFGTSLTSHTHTSHTRTSFSCFLLLLKQSIMSEELAMSIVEAAKVMEKKDTPYTIAAILTNDGGRSFYVRPDIRGFYGSTNFLLCYNTLAIQGYLPISEDDPLAGMFRAAMAHSDSESSVEVRMLLKKPFDGNGN